MKALGRTQKQKISGLWRGVISSLTLAFSLQMTKVFADEFESYKKGTCGQGVQGTYGWFNNSGKRWIKYLAFFDANNGNLAYVSNQNNVAGEKDHVTRVTNQMGNAKSWYSKSGLEVKPGSLATIEIDLGISGEQNYNNLSYSEQSIYIFLPNNQIQIFPNQFHQWFLFRNIPAGRWESHIMAVKPKAVTPNDKASAFPAKMEDLDSNNGPLNVNSASFMDYCEYQALDLLKNQSGCVDKYDEVKDKVHRLINNCRNLTVFRNADWWREPEGLKDAQDQCAIEKVSNDKKALIAACSESTPTAPTDTTQNNDEKDKEKKKDLECDPSTNPKCKDPAKNCDSKNIDPSSGACITGVIPLDQKDKVQPTGQNLTTKDTSGTLSNTNPSTNRKTDDPNTSSGGSSSSAPSGNLGSGQSSGGSKSISENNLNDPNQSGDPNQNQNSVLGPSNQTQSLAKESSNTLSNNPQGATQDPTKQPPNPPASTPAPDLKSSSTSSSLQPKSTTKSKSGSSLKNALLSGAQNLLNSLGLKSAWLDSKTESAEDEHQTTYSQSGGSAHSSGSSSDSSGDTSAATANGLATKEIASPAKISYGIGKADEDLFVLLEDAILFQKNIWEKPKDLPSAQSPGGKP